MFLETMVVASLAGAPLPKPQKLDTTFHVSDYMRVAAAGVEQWIDFDTTRTGLRLGAKEVVLPHVVTASTGRLAAYEGITLAVRISGDVWLVKHNHRTLATATNWTLTGVGFLVDGLNEGAINTQRANNSHLEKR
jgi:hypothetical protein